MKYLKYFESYRRKGPGELPLKAISKEEFKDFLQTNCRQFLEVVKDIDFTQYNKWRGPKQLIYRKFKMNYGNFVLTNPKESEHRRIAPWSDWGNWHNLLISNLDSWRKYPRRNKSMIVSGWDRAYGHGGTDLYLVIPFDTTKLGVCRGNDFWEAFNVWEEKRLYIPDWVKRVIDELIRQSGVQFSNDDSWEDLLPYLDKKYDKVFFDEYNVNKTLLENLNKFLDPKKNQFNLETFKNVSKLEEEKCRECWFEDDAILISWNYLMDLKSDELNSLFN